MMQHDENALEAVALLALGVLPEADAQAVREHIASCEACAAEYRDLRAAADLVGYAAETEALSELQSARMRSRVMRSIERDAAPAPAPAPAARAASVARRPWLAYLAAAAAIVVALLSSFNNAALRSENDDAKTQLADLRRRVAADEQASRAAHVADATREQRLAEALALGERFPVPAGQVVRVNGRIVMALHLRPLPAGKVYQAWTLANGAKAVAPSITFSPDPSGVAVIELPQRASGLVAVAVSVEPAGGSKAPTTQPTFIRKLS